MVPHSQGIIQNETLRKRLLLSYPTRLIEPPDLSGRHHHESACDGVSKSNTRGELSDVEVCNRCRWSYQRLCRKCARLFVDKEDVSVIKPNVSEKNIVERQ